MHTTTKERAFEEATLNNIVEREKVRDIKRIKTGLVTQAEHSISDKVLQAVAEAISTVIFESKTRNNGAGRSPMWLSVIGDLDPTLLAIAAVRGAMVLITGPTPVTRLLRYLGTAVERVVIASQIDSDPESAKLSNAALVGLFAKKIRQHMKLPEEAEGPDGCIDYPEAYVALGNPLLSALMAAGFVETYKEHKKTGNGGEVFMASFTTTISALISSKAYDPELIKPTFRPMLVQPKAWSGFYDGAYMDRRLSIHLPLVPKCNQKVRQFIKEGLENGEMTPALEALNIIQDVPFAINPHILAIRQWMQDEKISIPNETPQWTDHELPEVPEGPDVPEETRRSVLRRYYELKGLNATARAERLQWQLDMDEARYLHEIGGAFYLPHRLDFRGRVYPAPSFNHQRCDAVKALFNFYRKERLGPGGLFWLKVHIANCLDDPKVFGDEANGPKLSKRTFEERVAYVDGVLSDLLLVAEAPTEYQQWMLADAPFSFLAAIIDLYEAMALPNPEDHHSSIPVALDGCNSGVQHYSAMTRAEEGALVGLAGGRPADLYALVAEKIMQQFKKDVADKIDVGEFTMDMLNEAIKNYQQDKSAANKLKLAVCAKYAWMLFGITRSVVKRPVMTYGYSATERGMGDQIREDVVLPILRNNIGSREHEEMFGCDNGLMMSVVLGSAVYNSIEHILPKVAATMRWLRYIAGELAKVNEPVCLKTPAGFPLMVHYPKKTVVRPLATLLGIRYRLQMWADNTSGELDKQKQKAAVAPNVVHAADACHLMLTVRELANCKGIKDIMVIHDSFATHAANAAVLHNTLPHTLAAMYSEWNPLHDIHQQAENVLNRKLEPPPAFGPLTLAQIANAPYAFS